MSESARQADASYGTLMRRAISLAERGPKHNRNPRVGCVIVDADGQVLAEGWHRGAGTEHAEVDALSQLAPGRANGATAIVTLEPCNHTGTTGPCTQALIDAGVARVVFGCVDPGVRSRGGASRLAAAGIDVIGGVLLDETTALIDDWLFATENSRPFVTVKWASSLDGRTAADDGTSQWITGDTARRHVHDQRAQFDAIIVGTGTVLADDPRLTARDADGALFDHQPVPVVVGTRPIPAHAAVFAHPHRPVFETTRNLNQVLSRLYRDGHQRVLVEAGPRLASAFVAAGLVDEYLIYLAPILLGGERVDRLALGDIGVSTLADKRRLEICALEQLGGDILIRSRPATPAVPAPQPTDNKPKEGE